MRKNLFLMLMVLIAAVSVALAEQLKCDVCGRLITGDYFHAEDHAAGGKKLICTDCSKLENRCFLCGLPVKEGFQNLPDGRVLCARDAKLAVVSDEEAKQICEDVHNDLDSLFSRFMTFPGTNRLISIVNRFYLENLFKSPEEGQACVSVYGATCSNVLPGDRMVHSVCILSHLPKARLMAVCAHEYTHAWMGQNVSRLRRNSLDKDTLEAFCELVAYKYMKSRDENFQMHIIQENNYTKGKIDVLIAADARFGFGSVMEWIKSGEDAKLEIATLDRIRAVEGTDYVPVTQSATLIYAPVAAHPVAAPDTLILKSISGPANHRFALINSTTFEPMEKARVRVGQTNVTLRCLEIKEGYVTVQLDGSTEKKQLALKAN